jgi:hypothetical protein
MIEIPFCARPRAWVGLLRSTLRIRTDSTHVLAPATSAPPCFASASARACSMSRIYLPNHYAHARAGTQTHKQTHVNTQRHSQTHTCATRAHSRTNTPTSPSPPAPGVQVWFVLQHELSTARCARRERTRPAERGRGSWCVQPCLWHSNLRLLCYAREHPGASTYACSRRRGVHGMRWRCG